MWVQLFTQFIVPLLRAHFYITDSQKYNSRTLYFRKSYWARASGVALNHLRHTLQLQQLTKEEDAALMCAPDR